MLVLRKESDLSPYAATACEGLSWPKTANVTPQNGARRKKANPCPSLTQKLLCECCLHNFAETVAEEQMCLLDARRIVAGCNKCDIT